MLLYITFNASKYKDVDILIAKHSKRLFTWEKLKIPNLQPYKTLSPIYKAILFIRCVIGECWRYTAVTLGE